MAEKRGSTTPGRTGEDPPAPRREVGYDLLRILSVCGVVAIHTFGPIAANPDISGSAAGIASVILSTGFVWAVPVFVMLAGALNLREETHLAGPRPFYARRARRIVPAIIAWTVIYVVIVRVVVLHEQVSLGQVVIEILDARVYPHLYFLWLIAGLYLVAPVLAAFLHRGGRLRAMVSAGVALGLTLVVFTIPHVLALKGVDRSIQLGALTIWIAYIGYFLAGYAMSLGRVSRRGVVWAGLGVVVFASITLAETFWPNRLVVLRAVAPPEYLGVVVAALSICVFVVGVSLLDRIHLRDRALQFVVTLSEASFGVYLVHLFVMLVPYWLLSGYNTRTSVLEGIVAYACVLVVSFALSIGARRVPGLRLIF